MNLDDYMNLTDKLQDMQEDMDDVQEMMMDGMTGDIEMDEEELDRELASIKVGDMPEANPLPMNSAPATQTPAEAMPMADGAPAFPSNWRDELSNL